MELNDKLPVPERSSFTSPLVTAIDSIAGGMQRQRIGGGRELSAALRRVLEQRVADGGMHWNGVGVAHSCSIAPVDEELTPTGGAVTRQRAIGKFLGRVRAPAVSFVTVDSTASRKRPVAIF